MFSESAMWWVIGLLSLACGLLLRLAFFARRRGDTPYCRKCRYNLTGVGIEQPGGRCPECGPDLAARRPILGVRPPRRWAKAAFAGTLLLTIGYCGLVASESFGKLRPIEYLPESWLIARVERDTGSEALAALSELMRRDRKTPLVRTTVIRLIETGLHHQAAVSAAPPVPKNHFLLLLLYDLSQRLAAGGLSEVQTQRFVRNAAKMGSIRLLELDQPIRWKYIEVDLLMCMAWTPRFVVEEVRVYLDEDPSAPPNRLGRPCGCGSASMPLSLWTELFLFPSAPGSQVSGFSLELDYILRGGDRIIGKGRTRGRYEPERVVGDEGDCHRGT